ncbi:hypothetical protein D3C75_511250 [compost metagenome]|uniref:TniQ domain-containing protein n=1 Tax=Pseudomonas fluorescens TaxID=294 RepID=A0A5E7RPI5_PSEFL|nr:TniQ family protein [Pseudomonas fluorescens]VVP75418.1 hypothetical protein PS938_00175 [Pseudomonas fluorescens]
MKRLCFVATPYHEESPSSILMRTAFHNGYKSVHELKAALNISKTKSLLQLVFADGNMCIALCGECPDLATGLNKNFYSQLLKLHTYRDETIIAGMTVPWTALRRPCVFCPLCLQEGHMRFIQDIAGFQSCPYHNVQYLTVCTACNRPFKWKESVDYHCRCGFDLRLSPSVYDTDDSGLKLLELFHNHDQETFNRTFAALQCLNVRTPTTPTTPSKFDIFRTALEIGLRNEKCLSDFLNAGIKSYGQMHPSAITAPWLLSNDAWIQATTAKLNAQRRWKSTPCAKPNCCAKFSLTSDYFIHHLAMTRTALSEATSIKNVIKKRIGKKCYYTSDNMCEFVADKIGCANHLPNFHNIIRSDYCHMLDAVKILHLPYRQIHNLIDYGYFKDCIKINKTHILIAKKTITNFATTYISSSELASALSIKIFSTTLHEVLKSLNIQALELPSTSYTRFRIYPRASINSKVIDQIIAFNDSRKPVRKSRKYLLPPSAIAEELNLKIATTTIMLKQPQVFVRNIKKMLSLDATRLPHFLHSELRYWRKHHYTSKEAAARLNMSHRAFSHRFGSNKVLCRKNTLRETFYDDKTLKSMEKQCRRFITKRQAQDLGDFSENQLEKCIKLSLIRQFDCINQTTSKVIHLVYLSDVLACEHASPGRAPHNPSFAQLRNRF